MVQGTPQMDIGEHLIRIIQSEHPASFEIAYIDETGDTGEKGSDYFGLGCVIVSGTDWTDRLDVMHAQRRIIRDTYGVTTRTEIKANHLLRGRGPIQDLGLGDGQRRDIYMRLLATTSLISTAAFGVFVSKRNVQKWRDPAETAWTYLLQRLRLRSEATALPIVIVHDDGDAARVRKIVRGFRRHSFAADGSRVQAPLLVEDPVPRNSQDSYFIQVADLAAYAAFRRLLGARRPHPVCNHLMWDVLSSIHAKEVTNGRQDAIVVWP